MYVRSVCAYYYFFYLCDVAVPVGERSQQKESKKQAKNGQTAFGVLNDTYGYLSPSLSATLPAALTPFFLLITLSMSMSIAKKKKMTSFLLH